MADDTTIRSLLEALLARPNNAPEFEAEVEGYLEDLDAGELDDHDRNYILQLAERLGIEAGAEPGAESAAPAPAPAEADADDRFEQAKEAFVRLFHPDTVDPDAPDAEIRKSMFEEFWAELERIERGE